MKRQAHFVRLIVLSLLLVAASTVVSAKDGPDLPLELTGEIKGAAYVIRVPENWNGVLLLYAHGYTLSPGAAPEAAFLGEEGEALLLDEGYALAASAYRGMGWNVREGIWDTKKLLGFFEKEVGRPEHVILYGISMGGDISIKSMEKYPNLYSAAVPMCSAAAGATADADHLLDYALAYDVAFGWPEDWGTVGDVRDDIDFYEDVWFPKVYEEIFTPSGYLGDNYAKWEFIRRVTHTQLGGHYEYTGPIPSPPGVVAMSYFMTVQRGEQDARAGGVTSQNVGRVYSLSEGDRMELVGMGIPVDEWLAEMNARAIYEADRNARQYVERYGDFTGNIHAPMLLAHTAEDSICSSAGTADYRDKITTAGNEDLFVRAYSALPGHCNFTAPQMLRLFEATVDWLETGVAPTQDDFPAELDFAPGFEPDL